MPFDSTSGEPAVAIQHAEEILEVEPFRETAYQELMPLHAAMGNRAEALRVFARCRNRLRSELGTTPSAETEGVWRVIDTRPAVSCPDRSTQAATRSGPSRPHIAPDS